MDLSFLPKTYCKKWKGLLKQIFSEFILQTKWDLNYIRSILRICTHVTVWTLNVERRFFRSQSAQIRVTPTHNNYSSSSGAAKNGPCKPLVTHADAILAQLTISIAINTASRVILPSFPWTKTYIHIVLVSDRPDIQSPCGCSDGTDPLVDHSPDDTSEEEGGTSIRGAQRPQQL